MWILFAFLSAFFSGLSVIFQKEGSSDKLFQVSALSNTSSLIVMLIAVLCTGSIQQFLSLPARSWNLALSSGFVQALSWIAYFAALREAKVNAMMSLDKINIAASMVLSYYLLGERISVWMIAGCGLILLGSCLAADLRVSHFYSEDRPHWVLPAVLSPCLQALANVLAKMDYAAVDPNVTTTLRTGIVVLTLWIITGFREGFPDGRALLHGRAGIELFLGGAMIGISYLFMYRAIHDGINAVVAPIVKLNFLVSAVAARILLREKLTPKGVWGVAFVLGGVFLFLVS